MRRHPRCAPGGQPAGGPAGGGALRLHGLRRRGDVPGALSELRRCRVNLCRVRLFEQTDPASYALADMTKARISDRDPGLRSSVAGTGFEPATSGL
ncbi:protein of unknown function [Streptomyces sp. KY70]|nr:protein of unknown function [Streptomyces sp. KY70]